MRVLVTGGAGFIGSHVVDAFLEAGHSVAVVDDLSTGKLENLNPAARFVKADLRDRAALEKLLADERPEIISHQAAKASLRESFEQPVLFSEVNLIGSLQLIELARHYGLRKMIYASTGGAVYGNPQSMPVTEAHPVNPLDPYGASKHAFEHLLHVYQVNYGIAYTVLRYANVYGPRQDPFGEAGVVAIFAMRLLRGEQPIINGDGKQERDFVYAGDIARANLLAADAGDGEILNIGCGVGTDINTVYSKLRELAGSNAPEQHGPAKMGEVRAIALDASRARRILNWQPGVDLDEGLRRTVDFFRQKQVPRLQQ